MNKLTILLQSVVDTAQVAEGVTLTTGNVISLLGFLFALGGLLVTVGYFKGKFEGLEKDVHSMREEKKKELTEQGARNSSYDVRLARIEEQLKNVFGILSEIKSMIK